MFSPSAGRSQNEPKCLCHELLARSRQTSPNASHLRPEWTTGTLALRKKNISYCRSPMMCLGWCWNRAGVDQIRADVDMPTLLARARETARNASRWRPAWTTGTLESRKNISWPMLAWGRAGPGQGLSKYSKTQKCRIYSPGPSIRVRSPPACIP